MYRRRLPSFCLRDLAQPTVAGEAAPAATDTPAGKAASNTLMATTGTTANIASMTTPFQTRQLGDSDLHLSPIGFGAWAIGGGDWEFGWGAQEDQASIDTIERALELGINWIDTAAIYGLGHSEEVVARMLKHSAHKPLVFTKCSMRWTTEDRKIYRALDAKSVRQELEDSLRRLERETIDLYQVHWPNPEDQIEESWATLAKLKEEGKIRYIGVSNFSVEQMRRVQKIAPITSLQPPYSLVNPKVETEILPFCLENNIGVINYSPMASGLLTGKMTAERVREMPADDWRKKSPNFNEPKLTRNLALAALLGEIGKQHEVEAGVVAIAWTLHNPAVTAAIVGARRPDQVDGILPAATFRLAEEELTRINDFVRANPA
ncbi:aldo/keto reductase [Acidipila sp. EB88]|uniref:aldo/keto reductase n=1 Tax=Acidipila sp. EB88 TaxID=2305226 RepID=UPI00269B7007